MREDSYCYFGSRYFGKNSVLDIFYKYHIVFAGMKNADKYKDEFKAGTKIAICEGKKVKAIGIAIEDFNTLDNLDINFLDEEKKLFEIEEWVLAVKVKIFKLEEKDYFEYDAIMSGFSPINTRKDIKYRIDELIKKYSGEKMKEEIINILKNKKQIILQGAPGTGKTYSSSEIAVKLIDGNVPSDRAELMKRYKELVDKEQIFFTTFHQSMDYEEFVEGIKPNTLNDNIIYELEDGIFKKACYSTKTAGLNKTSIEKAWNEFKEDLISKEIRFDSNNNNIGKITLKTKTNIDFYLTTDKNDNVKYKPSTQNPNNEEWRHIRASLFGLYNKTYESALSYTEPLLQYLKVNYNLSDAIENNKSPVVLIIDEINRGNISKIFGELFMLIENDKRGEEYALELVYKDDEKFFVPENLYIIGLMNTADRSLAMLDYALRRRFIFIDIEPAFNKPQFRKDLESKNIDKDLINKIIEKFIKLNEIIKNDKTLGKGYTIGHSYFCNRKNLNKEDYEDIINYEIAPTLREYWFDNEDKAEKEIKELLNI